MRQTDRSKMWPDDDGRFAVLPDGSKVDLYTQFPSNGVFRLPDLSPVYFLDCFDRSNRFVVSPDLNSVVLLREWAVDNYPTRGGRPMPKAMQFYRAGEEIRSYRASELVENPGKDGFFHTMPWVEYWDGFNPWTTSFRGLNSGEMEVITAPRGL